MSALSNIASTLQDSLGVTVTLEWLEACSAFLNHSGGVDAVISQLLVSDLRDVVRQSSSLTTTTTLLHQAIQQSMHSNSSKQTLDVTLLVQMEEAVNVSLNAEARLERAGPPRTGQQPQHSNNNTRCLKLFLTDGYLNSKPIVAMEVQPLLPHWNPEAGCKLLLKGSLVVRWGILQLHPGNTIVVGGKVAELCETQAKALEQAQQRGGVGVDATIRALIGTNPVEETPEMDEGEGESGDVVLAPPSPQAPRPLAEQQPMPPRTTTTMPPPSSNTAASNNNSSSSRSVNPYPRPTTSLPENPTPRTAVLGPTMTSTRTLLPTSTTLQREPNRNPYASTSTINSTSQASSVATAVLPRTGNALGVNPYQRAAAAAASSSTTTRAVTPAVSTMATTTTSTSSSTSSGIFPPAPRSIPAVVPAPPARPLTTTTTSSNPYANSALAPPAPARTMAGSTVANATSNNTNMIQKISFSELRSILSQLAQDQRLYESYYASNKCFYIDLQQKGSALGFNIGKEKQGKKKHYTFEIHTNFGVPTTSDYVVCKLPSALVEPLFSKTPAEIRAISRQDVSLAQTLVDNGGDRVKERFFGRLQTWKATLFQPPEQWLSETRNDWTNIAKPVLLIEPADQG